MPTWIALFRGINVGGSNVLPMKELVRVLESLGLKDVQTYIQSGNVVFQSSGKPPAKLNEKIAAAIQKRRGFRPHVLILSAARLNEIAASNPFPEAEANPKSLHVFFLDSTPGTGPGTDLKSLTKIKAPAERFRLIDDVFYLHAPDGIGRSRLAASVEKRLGVPTTARNWRTVQKLIEMA